MTAERGDPLEKIADDKAAIDAALRAIWPRLRKDQRGPLRGAADGLLSALAALDGAKRAIELGGAA